MNDQDNNGGSFLGTLLVGMGFAGIVLAPFYIAYRFGAHHVAGAAALMMTILAMNSADLVAMAAEMQFCGFHCAAAPGAQLIMTLDKLGWWKVTIFMWLMFGILVLARAVCHPKVEGDA